MVLDTIQLGVQKKPQGKTLSSAKLRGFFYRRWRGSLTICRVQQGLTLAHMSRLNYCCRPTARQAPDFQDNLCRQWHNPKRHEVATSFATALPAPFQDNSLAG